MSFPVCVTVHASLPPVVDWRRRPASVKDALNSAPRASSSHGPAPTTTVAVDALSGTCVVASRQRAKVVVPRGPLMMSWLRVLRRTMMTLLTFFTAESRVSSLNQTPHKFGCSRFRRTQKTCFCSVHAGEWYSARKYWTSEAVFLVGRANWFFTVGREDCTHPAQGQEVVVICVETETKP